MEMAQNIWFYQMTWGINVMNMHIYQLLSCVFSTAHCWFLICAAEAHQLIIPMGLLQALNQSEISAASCCNCHGIDFLKIITQPRLCWNIGYSRIPRDILQKYPKVHCWSSCYPIFAWSSRGGILISLNFFVEVRWLNHISSLFQQ